MSFIPEVGVLEAIAATLAVVMMLGPLVPYAIRGRQGRRARRIV